MDRATKALRIVQCDVLYIIRVRSAVAVARAAARADAPTSPKLFPSKKMKCQCTFLTARRQLLRVKCNWAHTRQQEKDTESQRNQRQREGVHMRAWKGRARKRMPVAHRGAHLFAGE